MQKGKINSWFKLFLEKAYQPRYHVHKMNNKSPPGTLNGIEATALEQEYQVLTHLQENEKTLLYREGDDLMTLKELAGHVDIGSTEIYAHVDMSDVRKAVEKHPLG